MRTADSCGGRAQQPHCVLQLDLRAPAPAAPADDGAGDAHVLMQLGVPELERLLHKLDAVQGQLDAARELMTTARAIMLNFRVCRHHADHLRVAELGCAASGHIDAGAALHSNTKLVGPCSS